MFSVLSRKHLCVLAATTSLTSTSVTFAADEAPAGDDVVVTAERRETNIQKTPLSISAVGGEALQEQRLQVLRDLAAEVPSLVTPGMHQNMQSVFIRGIGTSDPGVYPAVGLYIDDVYIPRTFGNGVFDLPDIQRVEVLRGPQGTLYGLNTSAGAIKFVSRDPGNEAVVHADIGLGNYDAREAHAYVAGPIVEDRLYASIAYTHRRRDGYIYNAYLDKDVDALRTDQFRAKLRWTPSGEGGFEAVASIDGTRERSDNASYVPGDYPGADKRTTFGNFDYRLHRNIGGAMLRLTLPVSDQLTVKSITAYRGLEDDPSPWDQDATPSQTYGWTQYIDQRQFSQELQLLGDFGALNFVSGISYFRERLDFARNSYTNDRYTLADSRIIDRSLGLYGQLTYSFTDKLSVTAGARVNKEWQKFNNGSYRSNLANDKVATIYTVANLKDDWSSFTPKLSINYQWTPDVLTYASFTKGQKSGGFNRSASNIEIAEVAVDPEEVTTYEIGLKAKALDGRLRTSIAGFYNQFDDYIASITNPEINGQVVLGNVVANAAKAYTYGAEGELSLTPVDAIELKATAAYLQTKFKNFANPTGAASSDYTGNELPYAPRWTLSGSATWSPSLGDLGDLRLTARARYTAKAFADVGNSSNQAVDAQTIVDLTARYQLPGDHWSLSANVTNLFDKAYRVGSRVTPALNVNTIGYSPPRFVVFTIAYDL